MIIYITLIIIFILGIIVNYLSNFWKEYFKEKKDIMRIFSSFLSDIKVDKLDWSIKPINIEDTKNNILYFSKRLLKIQKLYFYNKKINNNFDINEEEKKYIIDITKMFMDWLNNWLQFHKSELEKLSKTLWNQEKHTKNIEFKSVIELQKKRLEYYSSRL